MYGDQYKKVQMTCMNSLSFYAHIYVDSAFVHVGVAAQTCMSYASIIMIIIWIQIFIEVGLGTFAKKTCCRTVHHLLENYVSM